MAGPLWLYDFEPTLVRLQVLRKVAVEHRNPIGHSEELATVAIFKEIHEVLPAR
jgi:hypothetical protein